MNDAHFVAKAQVVDKLHKHIVDRIISVADNTDTKDPNDCISAIGRIKGLSEVAAFLSTEFTEGSVKGISPQLPLMPIRNSK